MRLYIAGPMRGMPRFNFDAFDRAALMLRELGHQVHSPAEMDRELGIDPDVTNTCVYSHKVDMAEVMRNDLRLVLECDGIVLLKGWEKSQGARLERIVAESTGRGILLLEPTVPGCLVRAPAWDHPAIWEAGRRQWG